MAMEGDSQKVVMLPGFEVSQARQKPITDVLVWLQCFGRYVAAMAQEHPSSTPGLLSHMLVVVRAAMEVEGLAWRAYDEVFREKMAAMGVKEWEGMDIQLYQEVCGGRYSVEFGWWQEATPGKEAATGEEASSLLAI